MSALTAQLARGDPQQKGFSGDGGADWESGYEETEEEQSDEDDDDYIDDDPAMPKMEGLLRRKDWDEGLWDDTYAILQRELLLLYRPDGIEMCAELLESIDTRDILDLVSDNGLLQLILPATGTEARNPVILCGPGVEDWATALRRAMIMFGDQGLLISGWLLKRSLDARAPPRERFVRVSNHYLRYFKGEGVGELELGSLNLVLVESVGPAGVEGGAGGCVFEVLSEHRLFIFETGSRADMQLWVSGESGLPWLMYASFCASLYASSLSFAFCHARSLSPLPPPHHYTPSPYLLHPPPTPSPNTPSLPLTPPRWRR